MKNNFLFKLLICSLLALSCKEKEPTEPETEQNEGTRTDTQLVIKKYLLPAGETAEFPSGFEIVASEGVDIQGNILIKPTREGDFTIRCLNGDMDITGKIIVQNDADVNKHEKIIPKSNPISKETAQYGTKLFFILDKPGSVISIGRGAQIRSGNGRNAQDELIVIQQGRYVGGVGAPGGDIIIRAHGGKLILADLHPGDAPLFTLGNGGNGANITVDRENFQTSGPDLELVGGRGGDSGILFLEADTIEGIPPVDQLDVDLLSGAIGGKGGNVLWDVVGWVAPSSPTLGDEKTYPLNKIIFNGGNGGNGAIEGGKGGYAAYFGVHEINERPEPVAAAFVKGGNGGDVFPSPLPISIAIGGEGGEYIVHGNTGWDGVHPDSGGPIHGASGGDVSAQGGNGGNVLEGVLFHSAIGGDGGNSEVAQTRLPNELQNWWGFRGFNDGFFYVVESGTGGSGADVCNGCPGGNAGSSGNVLVIGGDGGNVPNQPGARGGNGGDIWNAIAIPADTFGIFMQGGDGNPPGKGGCTRAIVISPGEGGTGYINGENGQYLGIEIPDFECRADGEFCGEELTCEEDSTGSGDSTDCWTLGSSFTAYKEETSICESNGLTQTTTYNWNENVTFVEDGFLVSGTYTYHRQSYNGENSDTTYNYEVVVPFITSLKTSAAIYPYCFTCELGTDYTLYFPSGGEFNFTCIQGNCTKITILRFNGCNPVTGSQNPSDWQCCNGQATYTAGEDCPP